MTGGYEAKPLTVTAFSAAAPAATRDRVVTATAAWTGIQGTGTDAGSVHRNRPIAFGGGTDQISPAGDLPGPVTLPDPDDVQRPENGPIKDTVGPSAPVPSAAAAAVEHLLAPVDQVVRPVPTFIGQATYTGSDLVALTGNVLTEDVMADRLFASAGEGTQPAMTMLSPQSHS